MVAWRSCCLLALLLSAAAPSAARAPAPRARIAAAAAAAAPRHRLHPAFRDAAALRDLIKALPKAELHLHIEGTLEVDLMFELARRNGVRLPYPDPQAARDARANYTCLEDFLELYVFDAGVLHTRRDFYDLTAAYLRRAASEGVAHAELHFDAQGHTIRGVPLADALGGIQDAIRAQAAVSASVILAFDRRYPEASAAAALADAIPFIGPPPGISAVGLAGPEIGNPPSKFEHVYFGARRLGLHAVAHAGEEGGPNYVRQALKLLGADRIDHGIRSLEDPVLVEAMAEMQVPITLCPVSNMRLQVYAGQLEARVREVLASGINVTINSDDPAYFGQYVAGNYEWVAAAAGLGPDALAALAANSFWASFIPQEAKEQHVASVWRSLAAWKSSQQARPQARRQGPRRLPREPRPPREWRWWQQE